MDTEKQIPTPGVFPVRHARPVRDRGPILKHIITTEDGTEVSLEHHPEPPEL